MLDVGHAFAVELLYLLREFQKNTFTIASPITHHHIARPEPEALALLIIVSKPPTPNFLPREGG